ncbi:MAG: hypothetical protein VX829_01625 [Pseudomonadota bacterium]|nr:hypothetical protein [Methylophaga aminisulfidivorans]MEC9411358.1 hypothetical protein [Pseudomonadota bacterium]
MVLETSVLRGKFMNVLIGNSSADQSPSMQPQLSPIRRVAGRLL